MTCTLETLMNSAVGELGATPPPHAYGGKHLWDKTDCPRVVWERLPASFGDPPATITTNPRQLWTKVVQIALHVWGSDEDACDQMVDNEIAAIDKFLHGSYRPTKLEHGAANEAWLSKGHAQILTIAIDFKVLDKVVPTAKVTTLVVEDQGHTEP